MKHIITASIVALGLSVTPAISGESKHTRASDGFKLSIKCSNSRCNVRGKAPNGKWGKVENGPGGRSNYLKLVDKYKQMGFE